MASLHRREFLATLSRAGLASVALAALPPWARSALATGPEQDLVVRNRWPEHWETSIAALGRSFLTPNDRFFVRSHFPAPTLDRAAYRLEVSGLVRTPLTLTLDDLTRMPPADGTHVLECAGNGRGLFELANTAGTQWGYGAVGNARWGGIRLGAVLERAGIAPEAKHVWFETADHAPMPQTPPFTRSIPLEKAMKDALLVHTMNRAPLPDLHGAPLRAIVPGWFGMASAKWVTRVRVEAAPSDNHFMVKGYRYVAPGGDPLTSPPVDEVLVKSLITSPANDARVPAGTLRVQGLSWAGVAEVRQVDVSIDAGQNWQPAGFMGEHPPYAWREWATEVDVQAGTSYLIVARARDGAGRVQPPAADPNTGGYANNSMHQVTVHARA